MRNEQPLSAARHRAGALAALLMVPLAAAPALQAQVIRVAPIESLAGAASAPSIVRMESPSLVPMISAAPAALAPALAPSLSPASPQSFALPAAAPLAAAAPSRVEAGGAVGARETTSYAASPKSSPPSSPASRQRLPVRGGITKDINGRELSRAFFDEGAQRRNPFGAPSLIDLLGIPGISKNWILWSSMNN